jgi:hypothetical protein
MEKLGQRRYPVNAAKAGGEPHPPGLPPRRGPPSIDKMPDPAIVVRTIFSA